MKGWQNNINYAQKINCRREIVQNIIAFEQFEYLNHCQDDYMRYQVPFSICFNLQHLIDSLKLNFIKIYKGQVLIIINEILQHLTQLHSNMNILSHGQLEPKNIFIQLKPVKENKLTIFQVPIYIKKINFVFYKAIEEENYQMDQKGDIQQIIKSIQQFIESIEDYQQCQLLQLIRNQMQQINNNINQDSLQQLCLFFNNLISQNVDLQTQQIKKGAYKESPNYESMIGLRSRTEKIIMTYLEKLSVWDFYLKIEISYNDAVVNQNEHVIYENQRFLFENHNSNEYDEEIKLILLNTLRNTIMLQFWKLFGEKFSTWTLTVNSLVEEFQNKTNIILQQLPTWYQLIKSVLSYCLNEIPKQIIDENNQQFKFELQINQIPKEKITKIFIKQLLIQFQNFDLFEGNLDQVLNLIKISIKNEVRKYYQVFFYNKICELTLELI